MANSDTPWGLKPILWDEANDCHYYPITYTYGTALFHNDPVLRVAAGTIERAAATGPILGVIVGLFSQDPANQFFPDNLTPVQYVPATTAKQYWALVCDNPNVFFAIQETESGTALAQADIGNNVVMVFTHAGNTTTGIAGVELENAGHDVTATLQLKVISLFDHIEPASGVRTALGDYAKWVVKINAHQLAPNTAGI